MQNFVAPELNEKSFTCSNCGVLAQQWWGECYVYSSGYNTVPIRRCRCGSCNHVSWWSGETEAQIHPRAAAAPMPHFDLSDACKADYMEARLVVSDSPRSAAALLRLCIQRLLIDLGGKGRSIDDDIAALVANGLPPQVRDALDICRVVGNNAVHPGELDVKDDPKLVAELFVLINFIAEQTIERERKLATLFSKLPQGARDAMVRRDAKALGNITAAASLAPPSEP